MGTRLAVPLSDGHLTEELIRFRAEMQQDEVLGPLVPENQVSSARVV